MGLRRLLPWWSRMAAKMFLARMPIPYGWWRALGIFRHGDMHDPVHAHKVFRHHLQRAFNGGLPRQGFTCLELGPGDSLLSGLVARAQGASRVYMVDAGDYVVRDIEPYRRMIGVLRNAGTPVPEAETAASIDELLAACNIVYLTDGIQSLSEIPTSSVDYVWSQVVLEHVPKVQFQDMLFQLHRVMRDDAMGSHSVDLRDHLGGGLNNLRFSDRTWEGDFFRDSGFYTNRIRYSEMLVMMEQAGFQIDVVRTQCWETLPTPRSVMARPYALLDEDELRVAEFEILMRPRSKEASLTVSG
ncbi:MAG: hypothetical protein AMJ84_11565 [Acidithiobacillales bacterium SM23_46]|nr:MAG: hypothetical protein AMS22_00805 [Thiotrichales bacterium SG8_50]KPK68207.1 MAG: hypothetical protein AMJ84_11565 [Acidithiobacillales bacterium SM23_46]